ncbi:MAG TPA: NeuD/PglB/VioB family sugar acetyltransferase [Actinospica sp.]|jgi:sugar O-acyltransferase (sialic acid O-acetyltransferase NeuD family)|nr:NeuD/PglB/VioB family sugar acetyltransferase [Actinospica sp.]
MTRELYIVGAGGFARETAQLLATCIPALGKSLRLLGFLDDDPALTGRSVDGVPVLGPSTAVHDAPHAVAVLCVGSPRDPFARMRLAGRLGLPENRYATVVHPTVSVSVDSVVGPGTVLLAQSVLTAGVRIGSHVAVMPRVVLTHDDVVEDYATLASGVLLGGGVRIGRGAYIGAGAMIREHVTIGAGSVLGMGSVVRHDVPPGEVWAGNPARRLRRAEAPAAAPLVSVSGTGGMGG